MVVVIVIVVVAAVGYLIWKKKSKQPTEVVSRNKAAKGKENPSGDSSFSSVK